MTTLADWLRVKIVLEGALERAAADQDAYVLAACGGDLDLLAQVQALLGARDHAQTFLETPAAVLSPSRTREDLAGRLIGSYQLRSWLGAGGMGDVYLAHDAKLDRSVALKFLTPEFAADGDRLRRFHQEARAASSLNHPHILVVHDFGEFEGRPYIVTEFVEGETLRQRLRGGRLDPRAAVEIASQVGGALAAAHARGLLHRDIKPENVMIRPDGYVKVLDFGLAKPLAADERDAADPGSRTRPGVVMGTPRYMSPEQARGLDLDARSDLWSLGVMLYEMLCGVPPFAGETSADVIVSLLSVEPMPLEIRAPELPPGLTRLVSRTLQRDRDRRYADAEELVTELRRLPTSWSTRAIQVDTAAAIEEATLAPAGERRRTTVLVSMIADYPALAERLAPAVLEELVARVRSAAIDTMKRHGGVVNQSLGEEIVSLFGIPSTHEDDDLRAVRAAAELHTRARQIGSQTGNGLRLRLQSGIHAGSVVAHRLRDGPRRYAVIGAAAQVAGRLAAAATADGVLVSPECYRVVAPFVKTGPETEVPMDGGAPAMVARAVLGESGLDSRLDAPARGGLTPYTGRRTELQLLETQVELAREGHGRLVLIAGEPGSGKSRLLHELRARVDTLELQVIHGRCRSYGEVASYVPFVEALHAAFGMRDPGDDRPGVPQLVARIRAIDAALEPFIPLYLHLLSMQSEVFPLPRHLRGEQFQAAMPEALAALFTSSAQRRPILLLLEDWHWADDASRRALRQLAEVVAAYPLLIAVTTRPEPGLLPEGSEHVVHVSLGPLDHAASLQIIKSVLGVDRAPDDFCRRLHERTGGNPFFLEEICQALREAGVVTTSGVDAIVDEAALARQLPDSVQAVIRSRLDRLAPHGREALRVASVIGREFSRRVLSEAQGGDDLSGAIEQLKAAGIIQQVRVLPDPIYRFKHALMQEVTYESLLEHQRKALHEAVGRAIERAPAVGFEEPLEQLAYHFCHAESWEDAIRYGLRAAWKATELSQFGDALSLLERVQSWLAHLPEDALRRDRLADVLLKQERLCETMGLRGRQLQLNAELIGLLAPHGASARLAEAYLRQGDVSTLLKRFDAADRALTTALRMSREQDDPALERSALRSLGLLRWHQSRHSEALEITEHALAIDRERQDDLAVIGDLGNLGNILRSLGDHDRALDTLEEALAMPAVASDPIKRSYILHNIANVHRALANTDRALEYLQRADESARAHMLPIQRSFHLTAIAHIHLQEGRVDESLRQYREAVELSRRARHADGLAQSLRMLGEVFFVLGRHDEALPCLEEAAGLFAQFEDREGEALMRQHVAKVLEGRGDRSAVEVWKRVLSLAQSLGDPQGELVALEGIARASRQMAPAEALAGYQAAVALASRLGETSIEASLRNTIGILEWERGAFDRALLQYEAALTLVRATGDRLNEGLTLNSIGVTLARLHRYEEARTALEDALAVNQTSGERLLEAHTHAALGDLAASMGRQGLAVEYFERARRIRSELRDDAGALAIQERIERTRALMNDSRE